MAGLKKIARMFGGITINSKKYVYDYISDTVVPEDDMPFGSERDKKNERAKMNMFINELKNNTDK
jgi:hypothetical protein